MVFVACVVNQLCVMGSIVRCRHFTNLINLVSGDRRRTNFPVREAHNAHDSFAVSAMKSVMWLWAIYHTPFSNHARTVLSFKHSL